MAHPARRIRGLVLGLGFAAAAEVAAALALTLITGWSWSEALAAFVPANSLMAVAATGCGVILAHNRPRNPIGWLFVASGLAHATSACMASLLPVLHDGGAPLTAQRLAATGYAWAWPLSDALLLPVVLLLFPDGRLPSPRWRPAFVTVVASAPLFWVEMSTKPDPLRPGLPSAFLTIRSQHALQPVWVIANARTAGALILAVASLILRYRRAGDEQRRQLLWILLAAVAAVAFFSAVLVASAPMTFLFAVPLIPAAVTVAVLRHQLLDIRLVVSRALAWLLLSVAAVGVYVVLITVLAVFVTANIGRSAVATVSVAILVAPLLPRLQRLVDRAMYGDRRDPARLAARVGELLQTPGGELAGVVAAVRHALRVPYVAVMVLGQVRASDGTKPTGAVHSYPLVYGSDDVGELLVGLRPGERLLAAMDRDVLALVAAPLAVAIHATQLRLELQAAQQRTLAAREAERHRLRRDLHDGLGPTLTGVALAADAAANLVGRDASRASELIASVRRDTRVAISDVRRLVDNLRPLDLDELGLIGAIRQRAEEISAGPGRVAVKVVVDCADEVPPIPAAVEVAAFRIATEALTNVVRHSYADQAVVRLRYRDALEVEITDDGPSDVGPWQTGVGLQAMRGRAAELGGRCEAGPSPEGGRVYALLPLGAQ